MFIIGFFVIIVVHTGCEGFGGVLSQIYVSCKNHVLYWETFLSFSCFIDCTTHCVKSDMEVVTEQCHTESCMFGKSDCLIITCKYSFVQ